MGQIFSKLKRGSQNDPNGSVFARAAQDALSQSPVSANRPPSWAQGTPGTTKKKTATGLGIRGALAAKAGANVII